MVKLLLAVLSSLVRCAVLALILFGAAGRWDLPYFWAFITVCGLFAIGGHMATDKHPGLMKEQMRPGPGQNGIASVAGVLLAMVQWVLAGLDVGRYQWTPPPPVWVQIGALVAMAGAYALAYWALRVNPFFSPVVRVQEDRGHHVVQVGPYRWVRHPAYTGTILAMLLGGPALGSWIAMIPGLLFVGVYGWRTRVEDEFLKAELAGYPEYCQSVRYALIPGIL